MRYKKLISLILAIIVINCICIGIGENEFYNGAQVEYFRRALNGYGVMRAYTEQDLEKEYTKLIDMCEEMPQDWLVWCELCDLLEIATRTVNNSVYFKAYNDAIKKRDSLLRSIEINSIQSIKEPDLIKGYRFLKYSYFCDNLNQAVIACNYAIDLLRPFEYAYIPLRRKVQLYIKDPGCIDPNLFRPYGMDEYYMRLYDDEDVLRAFKEFIQYGLAFFHQTDSIDAKAQAIRNIIEVNAFLAYSAYLNNDIDTLLELLGQASNYNKLNQALDYWDSTAININIRYEAEFYETHLNALYSSISNDPEKRDNVIDGMETAYENWIAHSRIDLFDPIIVSEFDKGFFFLDD